MNICFICKSSKKDDIQYGAFLKSKQFGVHTFCLYLSSNLQQAGADNTVFLGFLPKDIKNEVRRISLLKCCYCHQRYANIGCCKVKCRRTFHLICGIENKVENRFCKDFRSYCHRHARREKQTPSSTETCLICFDSLCAPGKKFNSIEMILAPCCSNGWFHKLCLQKFANTAGYFFKCPLCNDDRTFREQLPAKGIFIPNQDAAWELEPNAFAELLERPNTCSAKRCKNKKGRNAESENNCFVMCHTCGSTAIHKLCLSNGDRHFNCTDCSVGLEERDSGRESLYVQQNEDEYIDVCHVSDKEDFEIINRLIATSGTTSKENKRDSGLHNDDADISDEEITHATKKQQKTKCCEEDKPNNDIDTDDIRPCTSKSTARLRIGSESSDTLEELNRRSINETENTSGEEINICKVNKRRRVSNESDKTKLSKSERHKLTKRKSPNVFPDSDSDPEQGTLSAAQSIVNSRTSESSEEIRYGCRKRKGLVILSDSDSEILAPKQKCLINENLKEKFQCSSNSFINLADDSDDDSDSDPLEYFFEMIEKRNSQTIYSTKKPDSTGKGQTDTDSNKTKMFISASKEQNNLQVSCIAARTRRKTICSDNNDIIIEKKESQNENLLNNSCIALRTRRKTICGRTDFDKQIEYEMSYEKVHASNESLICLTDDDDRSETASSSDIKNFIVDDGYKEKDGKFDISCIANRTRRRKSLKCRLLPKIVEVSDCDTDSSNSSESLRKTCTFRGNRNNRRINSSSSEQSYTKIPSTRSLKMARNATESSNSKYDFGYHPSNTHRPHNSNRNRI